jgi:hypothetical protein
MIFFFCSIGIWTQDLGLARWTLYHWTTSPVPRNYSFFFFFDSTVVWTQGFPLARQVLLGWWCSSVLEWLYNMQVHGFDSLAPPKKKRKKKKEILPICVVLAMYFNCSHWVIYQIYHISFYIWVLFKFSVIQQF